METTKKNFASLLKNDNRYNSEAYLFVNEALDYAHDNVVMEDRKNNKVTAIEFLESAKQYAIKEFGFLAKTVLEEWGVKTTGDLGNIVYNLIKYKLWGREAGNTREEFDDVYNFNEVFNILPVFSYEVINSARKKLIVSYIRNSEYVKVLEANKELGI